MGSHFSKFILLITFIYHIKPAFYLTRRQACLLLPWQARAGRVLASTGSVALGAGFFRTPVLQREGHEYSGSVLFQLEIKVLMSAVWLVFAPDPPTSTDILDPPSPKDGPHL